MLNVLSILRSQSSFEDNKRETSLASKSAPWSASNAVAVARGCAYAATKMEAKVRLASPVEEASSAIKSSSTQNPSKRPNCTAKPFSKAATRSSTSSEMEDTRSSNMALR